MWSGDTFRFLRNLKRAETSLGSQSSKGRREHLRHLHPMEGGLLPPSEEQGAEPGWKPGKESWWQGWCSLHLDREKERESLSEDACALLFRRNSANLSLDPALGAMDSGELGLENSSGMAPCFSMQPRRARPKVKGEVARLTLRVGGRHATVIWGTGGTASSAGT